MSLDQISSLPPKEQEVILNGPALTPPNGTVSNFDNPPNNDVAASAALATCLVLTSLGFTLRVSSRIFCVKLFRVEDILGLIAFGLYIGYIYLNYWLLGFSGFFVHQWDIRVRDLSPILYRINVGSALYGVCACLLKVAILKEWSRIFVPWPTRNGFWWICHILMAVNIIYYIIGVSVSTFACIPRQKIWDKTIPGGKCLDSRISDLTASVVNLTSDLIVFALPQRIIWKLQMSLKRRIGISIVFTVGVLTCVASTVRLYVTISSWLSSDDTVYAVSFLTLWAIAELTCMMLVFCVPAAPKVLGNKGLVIQIATSLRSWISVTPKESVENLELSLRRRTQNKASESDEPTGIYHKITNQTTHPGERQVTRTPTSEYVEQLHDPIELQGISILRTTHFTTTEEHVEGGVQQEQYTHQHPWVNCGKI